MPSCCDTQKITISPDFLVSGAGSGGFSAAITAADEGASVVIVGDDVIGGTCVNTGCIPSKTMIRAAETLYHALCSAGSKVNVELSLANIDSLRYDYRM